jgi:hypothetical protein
MVIGIVLNVLFTMEWYSGKDCNCQNSEYILLAALVMYGSYLFLFVQFFVNRYLVSSSKKEKPE